MTKNRSKCGAQIQSHRSAARVPAERSGQSNVTDREAYDRELSDVRPVGKKRVPVSTSTIPAIDLAVPIRFRVFWGEDRRVKALREGVSERELRRLKAKSNRPSAELDLHGLHATEVAVKVRDFVREQHARAAHTVVLIHGKGIHSEDGVGVLYELVVKALTEGPAARFVRAFTTASEDLGGRGALVVQLMPLSNG